MPNLRLVLSSFFALLSVCLMAQQPIELGTVNWLRDFDQAIAESQKQQKPVFILFQEVPGCATCQNYGSNVLSHPLIAEAIETPLYSPWLSTTTKKERITRC